MARMAAVSEPAVVFERVLTILVVIGLAAQGSLRVSLLRKESRCLSLGLTRKMRKNPTPPMVHYLKRALGGVDQRN